MMIVCDIGTNWMGSTSIAKELISRIVDLGCIPKMQIWRAHELYSKDESDYEIKKKFELDIDKAIELHHFQPKLFFSAFKCSDFYRLCYDGVSYLKIAHRDRLNFDLLKCVVDLKKVYGDKKTIVSTDVSSLHKFREKHSADYVLWFDYVCYCIPQYPANMNNLLSMIEYVSNSNFFNGVSLHTTSLFVLQSAIEKEIPYIEIHCTLDRTLTACTPDNCVSFTIDEIKEVLKEYGKL